MESVSWGGNFARKIPAANKWTDNFKLLGGIIKHNSILPNDVAKLKPTRSLAYGLDKQEVYVKEVRSDKTYKKNWIVDIDGRIFKESDFTKRVGTWG